MEARVKAEANNVDRIREFAEVKEKDKADISRLAAKARYKAEAETRARNKSNAASRVSEEAVDKIRARVEAWIAKRERA